MAYDREALLASTDLEAVFLAHVGESKGRGASARWPCPSPEHPKAQSGDTPPVALYPPDTRSAWPRWKCHACGANGTAIDVLVAKGWAVADAFDELAHKAGHRPQETRGTPPATPTSAQTRPSQETPNVTTTAPIECYAADCERALWEPAGAEVRDYLHRRGWSDAVLKANRIGADVGSTITRAAGLPDEQPAAVFPVLGDGGTATYLQSRPLRNGDPKYLNPNGSYGASPRLAVLATPPTAIAETVIICEGIPDALSAAEAGHRAVAILGAGYPDEGVARRLVDAFPVENLVVIFDNDDTGERGRDRLSDLLAGAGAGRRVWSQELPAHVSDLNDWLVRSGADFPDELHAAWNPRPLGWEKVASVADLLPAFTDKLADTAGAVAIPTGFEGLDRLLANGGWREGCYLLGAPPGTGKTALALQTAIRCAQSGRRVLFVSLEDPVEKLVARIFCNELSMGLAAYYNREPAYLAGVHTVLASGRVPFDLLHFKAEPYIAGEDRAGTMGRVRGWAEAIAADDGTPPFVIVDYLQRMRPPEADRRLDERLRISEGGKALTQLARDLETPVLAVSSIGRLSYKEGRTMAAYKGSGDLEYDADACLLLTLEEGHEGLDQSLLPLELHVVKNRYGPLTIERPILLEFDRRHGAFREKGSSPWVGSPARSHLQPVP